VLTAHNINRENDSGENTPDLLMFVNSMFVINDLHGDDWLPKRVEGETLLSLECVVEQILSIWKYEVSTERLRHRVYFRPNRSHRWV
jgi:hypothetical protein